MLIEGTDIVAKKDIRLEGSDVSLQPGYNLRKQQQEKVQKSSGITIALSGVVGSAINSAVQSIQAATQESDSRLALLQSMKAGLSGYRPIRPIRAPSRILITKGKVDLLASAFLLAHKPRNPVKTANSSKALALRSMPDRMLRSRRVAAI